MIYCHPVAELDKNRAKWFSAEMLIAYECARRGLVVSVPLAPCPYDILVDTGCLIKRIQVKRAKFKLKQGGMNSRRDREHYWVDLTKHSRGHDHRRIPANSFDFLAAVCEPDLIYLIPHDKLIAEDGRMLRGIGIKMPTEGRLDSIKAGQRWEAYRNNIDSVVEDGR